MSMKHGLFFICLLLTASLAQPLFGQELEDYVTFKGGVYFPTVDLSELDDDFSADVTFGHFFRPNASVEASIGYFGTEGTLTGFEPTTLGDYTKKLTYKVLPFWVTLKGYLQLLDFELYGGGGLGVYFTKFKADINSTLAGVQRVDDEKVTMGGHLLAGVNYLITDRFFVGVEGRYIITGKIKPEDSTLGELADIENTLTGFILTGNVGFKF
jgi:opacity protein-like surface antigen